MSVTLFATCTGANGRQQCHQALVHHTAVMLCQFLQVIKSFIILLLFSSVILAFCVCVLAIGQPGPPNVNCLSLLWPFAGSLSPWLISFPLKWFVFPHQASLFTSFPLCLALSSHCPLRRPFFSLSPSNYLFSYSNGRKSPKWHLFSFPFFYYF